MKKGIVGLFLIVLLILFASQSFAQQSKESTGGNIYLFSEYFENVDLDKLDPYENTGCNCDVFLFDARSFDIDLQNETLTAKVATIAKLLLPTTPLITEIQEITIDLGYWHTILYVESVTIEEEHDNIVTVLGRETYITVYGRENKAGKNHYHLLSPRQRIDHFNSKIY